MNTGQLILTIGAFAILSTMLLTFYGVLSRSAETIGSAQGNIVEIALATSIQEISQSVAFDEASIDSTIDLSNINSLTHSSLLGKDDITEKSIYTFDDFDDFHNFSYNDSTMASNVGIFNLSFKVYFVKPESVNVVSAFRTFAKKMDMRITRVFPPSQDTLKNSFVLGYFHFD